MTAIVTFIGWHDSGKTTLATQVVGHLKDAGLSVAVIKSSSESGIVFDTPGTDTDKHRKAGANSTLFVAPDQMVLQTRDTGLSLSALARRYFPDVDIVIGEGFKGAEHVAKIEVVRDRTQRLRDEVEGVIAVATDLDITANCIFRLDESLKIAAFLRERFQLGTQRVEDTVSLFINGIPVPLNRFVQSALTGTVTGFIGALKTPENAADIELTIRLNTTKSR